MSSKTDRRPVAARHGTDGGRRRFLKTAGAVAGSALASAPLLATARNADPLGVGPHHLYEPGTGSMMYHQEHDHAHGRTVLPGAPEPGEVEYREFDLSFDLVQHELLPGVKFPAFAFNGQVPGPVFRVQENDWVQVNVTNNTEEMHTVHWHGVDLIYPMDGVPMVSHDPIHPGETFVYRFQARPHGTRFYHCHWGTPLHMMSALHGAFIIDSPDDPIRQQFPYQRDYVLVLESFDLEFTREHINEVLEGMGQVNKLMRDRRLSHITHGFFKRYEDFIKAIEDGWRPPYTRGNAPGGHIQPNFFAINGKSFPATVGEHGHIRIRKGEYIRIRLINGGISDHHMHLHGHQFWKVAEDGNPLPYPIRLNTVPVTPGKTVDIIVYGDNPGFWDFHDHKEIHSRNNGIYPGGMITMLEYEDMGDPPYVPSFSVNQ
ncbi:MAG: multicopper oxidase domain-containing protein [Ectothiorhodospiraceae bacterium]|nr:multicopper oxidase domain-containing protein [Ectothiorhodospiraceae bacterium]